MNINLHAQKNHHANIEKNYQISVLENIENIIVDGEEINLVALQHKLTSDQTIRFECGESFLLLNREKILLHTPALHLNSTNGANQTIDSNNPKLKQYRLTYQWQIIGDHDQKQACELQNHSASLYLPSLKYSHQTVINSQKNALTLTDESLLKSAANLHIFCPEVMHG